MFGHKSDPSKIYSYGCRRPHVGLDTVFTQMESMRLYRNELVRAELDRRTACEEVIRRLRPDLLRLETEATAAETALEAARTAQKARNASARSTRAQGAAERAAIKQLRQARKEAYAAFREARKEAYAAEDVKTELATVSAGHFDRQRALRAASTLYWGNYLAVEQAAKSFGQGAPPILHRRTGTGRIAVQLQGGLPVADALAGDDLRFRLIDTGRRARHGDPIYEAWLRAGSAGKGGRQPVWAVCTCDLHRPLPEGAVVKWVYLHRRRRGVQEEWKLSVVVSKKDGWEVDGAAGDGAVAVNPGWRVVPGGVRVAYWVGSDGRQGELVLGDAHLDLWARCREVRGVRDDLLALATQRLGAFLSRQQTDGPPLPEWLAEWRGIGSVRQWRSPARLAAVVLHWRHHRFDGDGEVYGWLEGRKLPHQAGTAPHYDGWRVQDADLANLEAGLSKRATNKRENAVRSLAAELAGRYRTVVLAKVDWRQIARRPEAEDAGEDGPENETARRHRHMAAPGRTCEVFRERFAERAVVEAAYMTQRCCVCGRIDAFDAAAELVRECRHADCGAVVDQDERHCRNLLAAYRGDGARAPVVDERPGTARGEEQEGAA